MFFTRKARRKSKNAHILTFFTNTSCRLSILTRGSSLAEFEALLLIHCHPMWEFMNPAELQPLDVVETGIMRIVSKLPSILLDCLADPRDRAGALASIAICLVIVDRNRFVRSPRQFAALGVTPTTQRAMR
jgi:hypothetical protein